MSDPDTRSSADRQAEIVSALQRGSVPRAIRSRLVDALHGTQPWTATLTPAELLLARSHGLKPIATVSATCWMHYGWSWTLGHSQGWTTALHRLKAEAHAAGANAVLDVKMRTLPVAVKDSMDFSLVGTAVRVDGLPASRDPLVATVPALELIRLLEADVVPTGIAVGANYAWISDWSPSSALAWMGNAEDTTLSTAWEQVRKGAYGDLSKHARELGNGVLAHINFSQMFQRKKDNEPTQYLARHIVVATSVDAIPSARALPEVKIVVDLHAGATPLTRHKPHHQSYASNDSEGAI
jgi:hypothetical protein